MKQVFGYVRVSTVRQGEGVSLAEQKEAIEKYALKNSLEIVEWFEEMKTAAKQGRPLFSAMMRKLKRGLASGVIIHKIDRSARNLKDWSEIGELTDKGVDIHFAHESLDLNERSGRLSADILAVVASDFIRNQKQEVIKGMYGRLKQGIYPWPAPIGYKNTGKGNVKVVDPIQGPLVTKAYELYATRKYSLLQLLPIMTDMGLRSMRGHRLYINSLSKMLRNHHYTGIMKVKGQVFQGSHQPLVSPSLFRQVQDVFENKSNKKIRKHRLLFSKKISCTHCGYALTGETQKGHVYYRCHSKNCQTKGFRESHVEEKLEQIFSSVQLYPTEDVGLNELLEQSTREWTQKKSELIRSSQLQLSQTKERLERLTDAYLDQVLDSETFMQRKENCLKEIISQELQHKKVLSENDGILDKVRKFLELAKSLIQSYKLANFEEKLDLLETVTSNLSATGKKLAISIHFPFCNCISELSFCSVRREGFEPS